jgi:hypothetical protein
MYVRKKGGKDRETEKHTEVRCNPFCTFNNKSKQQEPEGEFLPTATFTSTS